MSPSSFTFKLSVPNDPDSVIIIGEVARHAAGYANIEAGAADAFAGRAKAAASKAMKAGGPTTLVVFAAANGALTATIGSELVSESLS
jgi:hypothetical protein